MKKVIIKNEDVNNNCYDLMNMEKLDGTVHEKEGTYKKKPNIFLYIMIFITY